MSAETLLRSSEEEKLPEVTGEQAASLGETVFSALAVDAELATKGEDGGYGGAENYEFTNSVTRLGDGQTVPDER
ncbi:MAG: hypothetical protein U5L95_04020 [Candidatus Saccharibacteria bacterium]|nr:hypothetical protein [Candidatus Saccharibacteria bacterium]